MLKTETNWDESKIRGASCHVMPHVNVGRAVIKSVVIGHGRAAGIGRYLFKWWYSSDDWWCI